MSCYECFEGWVYCAHPPRWERCPERARVLEALYTARTPETCRAALDRAGEYAAAHDFDTEISWAAEQTTIILKGTG